MPGARQMVRVERLSGVRELAPAFVRLSKREQAPALQSIEVRTIWRALTKNDFLEWISRGVVDFSALEGRP
jgi:hypothetical protein